MRFELTNSYAPGTNLTKLDHDPKSNTRHNTHSKKLTSTDIAPKFTILRLIFEVSK